MKSYRRWFKWVLTFLFCVFLFFVVHPRDIANALGAAEFRWILIAFFLLPLNLFLQAARWNIMVTALEPDIRFVVVLRSILYSFTYSIFTPARLGDIGRAFHIPTTHKKSMVVLALYEKMFAFGALLFVGMCAIGAYLHWIYWVIGGVVFVLLCWSKKWCRWIPGVQSSIQEIQRVPLAKTLLISLCFVLVYIVQFYCMLRSLMPIPFIKVTPLISIVLLLNSVPITFSGLGVRELITVYFFHGVGATEAVSASASLLLFSVNILLPTLFGFILHFVRKDES